MTELSFLIDLLLNHELPKPTKDLIADRIRDVEAKISHPMRVNLSPPPVGQLQAASTLAAMARHADPSLVIAPAPEMPKIEPVAVIAQTPATAAAMNHRNETISAAIAGKVDKSNGRPRKW